MGYYAHFSEVETEGQRSIGTYLESHSQKVEVQGSGPRTQAMYMEPGPVKTLGKPRWGSSQDDPQCMLPVPTPRTAEAGLAHYQSAYKSHRSFYSLFLCSWQALLINRTLFRTESCLRILLHSGHQAASTNNQGRTRWTDLPSQASSLILSFWVLGPHCPIQ